MASHKNQSLNPTLPDDIIFDLLSGLPVKTLLRFRSVCKSWLSLISSPDFIKTHLSISTKDPHFTHHHLAYKSGSTIRSCSLYSLLNHPVTGPIQLDCPYSYMRLRGYCNGLVCLSSNNPYYVYLWNPSTRKLWRLPKLDTMTVTDNQICYGFYYDERNDDFKVYVVAGYSVLKLSFYSSKSGCWRLIPDFPYSVLSCGEGVLADGAFHWNVAGLNYHGDNYIVSLDIKTETHRQTLNPKYGQPVKALGTFGKSLYALCNAENISADFWVMKEWGVEETWTKLLSIPFIDGLPLDHCYRYKITPICITVNGDYVLSSGPCILLYNCKDKITVLFDKGSKDYQCYFNYVESLVNLHSG